MSIYERFLKYVSFETTSDEESNLFPSTKGQLVFAEYLKDELTKIGMEDVSLDDNGYVYASLSSSKGMEDEPVIGFISHMDVSPAVSGKNIVTNLVHYTGGEIVLNNGLIISPKEFDFMDKLKDQDLIVTDGNTLLGADDKAGIAEIVSACEYLITHPEIIHRKIAVCFTPDEEIGLGASRFDIIKFGAEWAYTLDGGILGEIEYENFNAASAKIIINGINIHPGSAKNKMKNSILVANEFLSLLPEHETPAHTEGYEGFYHVCNIKGDESQTTLSIIIRDFDIKKFEDKKAYISKITGFLNDKYGNNTVNSTVKDSYFNMKEVFKDKYFIVENAIEAMNKCGIEPKLTNIRGGTDGATLSHKGLPCPNLSVGGANFHSVLELVSLDAMKKMTQVIIELAK